MDSLYLAACCLSYLRCMYKVSLNTLFYRIKLSSQEYKFYLFSQSNVYPPEEQTYPYNKKP